jgi:hypothetical protein
MEVPSKIQRVLSTSTEYNLSTLQCKREHLPECSNGEKLCVESLDEYMRARESTMEVPRKIQRVI